MGTAQASCVLGILPGVLGTTQATEAIKIVLGQGEPLVGRLLSYGSLKMQFGRLKMRRDPGCPVCGGDDPSITESTTKASAPRAERVPRSRGT